MVDGTFKDLPKRTTSNKILRDKVFEIVCYAQFDGYQLDFKVSSTNSLIKI